MLTPYAYLADGYLIFLRALRDCVRTNLQRQFGNNHDEWWNEVVKASIKNNRIPELRKNIDELYRAQEAEQRPRDPFEGLDPYHCERIIDHYHSDVFGSVFPNRHDVVSRLQVINITRNKALAHPRSDAVSSEDVKAALDDMGTVLRKIPGNSYEVEVQRLEALTTAVQAFVLTERLVAADRGQVEELQSRRKEDLDKRVGDSAGHPARAESSPDESEISKAVRKVHVLGQKELALVRRAIRSRKTGQGVDASSPLRYVWAELESKAPGLFPTEAILYNRLAEHPDRFELRRARGSSRAILVREVKAPNRKGKGKGR